MRAGIRQKRIGLNDKIDASCNSSGGDISGTTYELSGKVKYERKPVCVCVCDFFF